MSFLQGAIATALATVQTVAGVSIAYASGELGPLNITAVPGSTLSQIATDDASMLWHRDRDYLVKASLLNFGSGPVEPADGDTITEIDPVTGVTYVFAVLPLGNEPCWRWSDRQRSTYRIHTKLKSETPPA